MVPWVLLMVKMPLVRGSASSMPAVRRTRLGVTPPARRDAPGTRGVAPEQGCHAARGARDTPVPARHALPSPALLYVDNSGDRRIGRPAPSVRASVS
ncbi:exported hypothetical protein [Frigoribacterium sp. 9N]|nr:exported hypothetical protein [Frigoribacterium sp. 9N]